MTLLQKCRKMAHSECARSLKEDLEVGLIYDPYATPLENLPQLPCSICKGKGTWTFYTNDPINGEFAGKPAPCEFCDGVGTRPQLKFLTMGRVG